MAIKNFIKSYPSPAARPLLLVDTSALYHFAVSRWDRVFLRLAGEGLMDVARLPEAIGYLFFDDRKGLFSCFLRAIGRAACDYFDIRFFIESSATLCVCKGVYGTG